MSDKKPDIIQSFIKLGCRCSNNGYHLYDIQKWLREVHGIHINITKVYECSKTPAKFDGWNIYIAGKDFETEFKINSALISEYFDTYEEALEAGIWEAHYLLNN